MSSGRSIVRPENDSAARGVETLRPRSPPGPLTITPTPAMPTTWWSSPRRPTVGRRQRQTAAPAALVEDAGGSLDPDAFAARGIPIEVVQSPTLISVAEHTVMGILLIMKRAIVASRIWSPAGSRATSADADDPDDYAYNWTGLQAWDALYGKTVGLVGLGTIGSPSRVSYRDSASMFCTRNPTGWTPNRNGRWESVRGSTRCSGPPIACPSTPDYPRDGKDDR